MRILIDCTDTHFTRSHTGIQRVVRNLVAHAGHLGAVLGVECVPVVLQGGAFRPVAALNPPMIGRLRKTLQHRLNEWYFRVVHAIARRAPWPTVQRFLLVHRREFGLARILYFPKSLWDRLIGRSHRGGVLAPVPAAVQTEAGDILFLPDGTWCTDSLGELSRRREEGARIALLLHDIIPVTHPDFCNPGDVTRFRSWLRDILARCDAVLCNSEMTLRSLRAFCASELRVACPPAAVTYLGCDLATPAAGGITHPRLRGAFAGSEPVFLSVGTVEARKNQATLLDAFDQVWAAGMQARLVLLGRSGWRADALLERIRRHPLRNSRLYWFDDVDDGDLAVAYGKARAVILPSFVEGFGLPLVEALARGATVIASDIEAFREIGGSRVRYFEPRDSAGLAALVSGMVPAPPPDRCAGTERFSWPSWEDSTRSMLAALTRLCPPPS